MKAYNVQMSQQISPTLSPAHRIRISTGRPLKRKMSAKGRAAISAAQRRRWAKGRSGWTPARKAKYSKMMKERWADPKLNKGMRRGLAKQRGRIVSPETRAKISVAQKRYWATKDGAA